MKKRDSIDREVTRMAHNFAQVPMWNGTATRDVVEEYLRRFDAMPICNGQLRRVIFTPITPDVYSYRTERA